MADVQEMLKELLISSLEGAGKGLNTPGQDNGSQSSKSHGGRGLAAGAGLGAVALTPVALKGLEKLAREAGMKSVGELVKSPGKAVGNLGGNLTGELGSKLEGKVTEKVEEAGGPGGIMKDAIKGALPFGGGGGGDKGGGLGVGKGRRMPVQQAIDIGAPLEVVYNQWTQYEEWPKFMHRVVSANQDDPTKVQFSVKIWTRTRDFTAEVETQRPDERVKWTVSEGIKHAGVVTFHELGPNLTRVLLSIDVDPGGLLEKIARGARHVKRAARGDLHRFKAFIEMAEHETGAWRGVIEDGEIVEDHDPSYDEQREYSDADEILARDDEHDEDEQDDQDDQDEEEEEQEEQPRAQRRRRQPSSNGSDASDKPRARASSRSSTSRSASGAGSSRGRSSGGGKSSSRASSSKSGSSARSSKSSRSSSNGSSGRSSGRSKSGSSGSRRASSGSSSRSRTRGDN